MKRLRLCLFAALLSAGADALAWESDVHFGLTQWLAQKAGFDELGATTIATGTNRVDSGDMQFMDLVFLYACATKDDISVKRASEHHYPSAVVTPAPPDQRKIVPGGEPARKIVAATLKFPPEQAVYRLYLFGEGLHALQDTWSHQGVPDIPQSTDGSFTCDPTRVWAHPKTRGGWNSHKADLTMNWPADTTAMAKATYETLQQYPVINGVKRTAKSWDEIRPALDKFVSASTKSDKAAWFASQGIEDVSFLEGISLKDGAKPFELKWNGRKLPQLDSPHSRQNGMQADVLEFYNKFFERWVTATDFDAVATEFAAEAPPAPPKGAKPAGETPVAVGKADLAAQLKVWRMRDHGSVADIAHASKPLTAKERSALDAAAKQPNAYVRQESAADAFYPLLPTGPGISPRLPFFIALTPAAAGKDATAVAVTKFRHLPYDTVVVAATQIGGKWRVTSISGMVDH